MTRQSWLRTEGNQDTTLSIEAAESRQPPASQVSLIPTSDDCGDQNPPVVEGPHPPAPAIDSSGCLRSTQWEAMIVSP
jgi:hypothetical protein